MSIDVSDLLFVLDAIGCPLVEEDLDRFTEEHLAQAAAWASAVFDCDPVFPDKPSWLDGLDVRRCRLCACTETRPCDVGCGWLDDDTCTACTPPKSLRGLIDFLTLRPHVRVTHPDGKTTRDAFINPTPVGLYFSREGSAEHVFLPVNCRKGRAAQHETGLEFDRDGFSVTKFGTTFRYDYLAGANADPSIT